MASVLGIPDNKKGCYHSHLVIATANGPIPIMFTGPVLTSRNVALLGTVYFKVHGEEPERYYNIENAAVLETIKAAPRNTILNLSAQGNGKDPATHVLTVTPADAAPAVQQQIAQQQQQHQQAAPARTAPAQQPTQHPAQSPAPPPASQGFADLRPKTIAGQAFVCLKVAQEILGRLMDDDPKMYEGVTGDGVLSAVRELSGVLCAMWDKQPHRPLQKEGPNGQD